MGHPLLLTSTLTVTLHWWPLQVILLVFLNQLMSDVTEGYLTELASSHDQVYCN